MLQQAQHTRTMRRHESFEEPAAKSEADVELEEFIILAMELARGRGLDENEAKRIVREAASGKYQLGDLFDLLAAGAIAEF